MRHEASNGKPLGGTDCRTALLCWKKVRRIQRETWICSARKRRKRYSSTLSNPCPLVHTKCRFPQRTTELHIQPRGTDLKWNSVEHIYSNWLWQKGSPSLWLRQDYAAVKLNTSISEPLRKARPYRAHRQEIDMVHGWGFTLKESLSLMKRGNSVTIWTSLGCCR